MLNYKRKFFSFCCPISVPKSNGTFSIRDSKCTFRSSKKILKTLDKYFKCFSRIDKLNYCIFYTLKQHSRKVKYKERKGC